MRRISQFAATLGLVLSLALALNASASAKEKKQGGVRGVVQKLEKDSLIIKTVAGKRNAAEAGVEKTFKLTENTTYEMMSKVKGQKGPGEVKSASRDDLQEGSMVTVFANGDTAEKVSIRHGHKNQ